MTGIETGSMDKTEIMKGAVIGGIINAVINGAIQYFLLRGNEGRLAILPLAHTIQRPDHG